MNEYTKMKILVWVLVILIVIMAFVIAIVWTRFVEQQKAEAEKTSFRLNHLEEKVNQYSDRTEKRWNHNQVAFIEDVTAAATRALIEAKNNNEYMMAWINQVTTMCREARPGPYAYDPERQAGRVERG